MDTFQDLVKLTNLAVLGRVLVILLLAWLAFRLAVNAEKRLLKRLGAQSADAGQQARLKTLLHAGMSLLEAVILGAALLMLLVSFGINIGPLLASAGVAGLAISLGAQTLIKDFIGGALILFENTFKVGEVIEVNGITGTVERIELRTTQLRDFTGKLVTIPNGEIRTLSNTSRDWSRAVVDINLSTDASLAQAIDVLQRAAAQAAQDAPLKELLLEAPNIQGWSSLSEWAVQVRITAKTLPGKQVEAAIALRKAALEALQAAGIRLAQPPGRTVSA
jgi:small-conductance mechanosensitive channel